MKGVVRQGDIWYANLNPTKGSEQSGRRPVVVVSGNTLNSTLPIAIVCPVSSKLKSYPTCVTLTAGRRNGLKRDSEVITFQIRAISKKRLAKRIGSVESEELRDIIRGLGEILTY